MRTFVVPSNSATSAGAEPKAKSRIRRSLVRPEARSWSSIVPSRPRFWGRGSVATNQPEP